MKSEVENKYPIDFVVAIDVSSSMRQDCKLAHVLATIEYLISKLNSHHRLCIITFNHEVHTITDGLVQMTEANKKLIQKELQKMKAAGSTNISEALFQSLLILKERKYERLSRSSEDKGTSRVPLGTIMLFSDGMANVGIIGKKFHNYLQDLKVESEITIHTFGYGAEHDSKTLRNVALTSVGGVYYYIPSTQHIASTFGECLQGVLNYVARDVVLKFSANDGCRLLQFCSPSVKVNELKANKEYEVSIGSLYREEKRSLLFSMSLRTMPEELQHALVNVTAAFCSCSDPTQSTSVSTSFSVLRTPTLLSPEIKNIEVDKHINRWIAANAIQNSAELVSEGEYDAAQGVLQDAINRISQSPSSMDEFTINLLHDLEDCKEHLKDRKIAETGIHRANAYSIMYFVERSTGVYSVRSFEDEISTTSPTNQVEPISTYSKWYQQQAADDARHEYTKYISHYTDAEDLKDNDDDDVMMTSSFETVESLKTSTASLRSSYGAAVNSLRCSNEAFSSPSPAESFWLNAAH